MYILNRDIYSIPLRKKELMTRGSLHLYIVSSYRDAHKDLQFIYTDICTDICIHMSLHIRTVLIAAKIKIYIYVYFINHKILLIFIAPPKILAPYYILLSFDN